MKSGIEKCQLATLIFILLFLLPRNPTSGEVYHFFWGGGGFLFQFFLQCFVSPLLWYSSIDGANRQLFAGHHVLGLTRCVLVGLLHSARCKQLPAHWPLHPLLLVVIIVSLVRKGIFLMQRRLATLHLTTRAPLSLSPLRSHLELADLRVQREGVEQHRADERDVGGLAGRRKRKRR